MKKRPRDGGFCWEALKLILNKEADYPHWTPEQKETLEMVLRWIQQIESGEFTPDGMTQ